MLKITGDNYHEYKQISEIIWQFEANLWKIDPDDKNSPVNVLNEWEKKSKSLAKKGLKAGLSDMLAMSIDMSIDTKNSLNEQLISRGFPGLNELV